MTDSEQIATIVTQRQNCSTICGHTGVTEGTAGRGVRRDGCVPSLARGTGTTLACEPRYKSSQSLTIILRLAYSCIAIMMPYLF